MRHYIIDSGHSGVAFGRFYRTPGKRSPEVPPGIYEGEFNRDVAEHVVRILKGHYCVPAEHLTPGPLWTTLTERITYINWLTNKLKKEGNTAAVVSIHANADGNKNWTDTNFARMFHAKNASRESIQMARGMTKAFRNYIGYPTRDPRIVGFTMLTKTVCPAILIECGHMTHKPTAERMATSTGSLWYASIIADELARCPS